MNVVEYAPEQNTDYKRLCAVYRLIAQAYLVYGREGKKAKGRPDKRAQWYLYALRPTRLGGNVFWKEVMPLLQEQNRLRGRIRKATYTDEQWRALSMEDREAAFPVLFGDKQEIIKGVTLETTLEASSPNLERIRATSFDSAPSGALPADPVEDFTSEDWEEVDSGNNITRTSTRCTVATMNRDAQSYVKRTFAVDHFTDFEHLITTNLVSSDYNARVTTWALSNTYNTWWDMYNEDDGISVYLYRSSGGVYGIYAYDFENDNYDAFVPYTGTPYYLTIERNTGNTTFTCKIYTDSERTDPPADTLSMTCVTTAYKNLFAISSLGYYSDSYDMSMYCENLDLQEAAAGWGHDLNGVANASIAEINGVAIASITSVNGIT